MGSSVSGPVRRSVVAAAAVAGALASTAIALGAAPERIDHAAQVSTPAERGLAVQIDERLRPTSTPYQLPTAPGVRASWGSTHSSYPATDVFAACGSPLVSPVHGTVLELRRVDLFEPAVDDPATRGGKYVSILGFDGVRYYLAHLDAVVSDLAPGAEVLPGQVVGTVGDTGRSSACHLHLGISPPCPGKEWAVRRGVVWPHPYLDAWRAADQRSPAPAVREWLAAHPAACATAMSDPHAPGA